MGKKGEAMNRPRGTGSIFQFKNCAIWYLKYYKNGVAVRESSHSDKQKVAEKLLAKRLAEISTDTYIEPRDRKVTVDELYAALLNDYQNNELASLEGAEQRWRTRLAGQFGGLKALAVTTDSLNRYVALCREQELSNGTINRDLAALRRAFNLALKAGKIQKVPSFPHLKEAAPRQGFVGEREYQRLTENASELWLRALLTTAYSFGFRKGELLNLLVKQVDLMNRTIRLNAGETKSGDGRVVVMTSDVYTLLQACVAGKSAEDYVFTRANGKRVAGFRKAWASLTRTAGCPDLLFHDLRRSGVRNMIRRGIPEVVAMRISGHKTRAVFDRYNIVSESDLADAARRIEAGKRAEVGQNLDNLHKKPAAVTLSLNPSTATN